MILRTITSKQEIIELRKKGYKTIDNIVIRVLRISPREKETKYANARDSLIWIREKLGIIPDVRNDMAFYAPKDIKRMLKRYRKGPYRQHTGKSKQKLEHIPRCVCPEMNPETIERNYKALQR